MKCMLRPIAVALVALLLLGSHSGTVTLAATPLDGVRTTAYLEVPTGVDGSHTSQPPTGDHRSRLATTVHVSPSLIIAAAVGAAAIVLLILLMFFTRIGAFSRSVDHRRVRRAKFQDEWTGVIRAADRRAREMRDRKQK